MAKINKSNQITRSLTPTEIRNVRLMVNSNIDKAKHAAVLGVLNKYCNEVDVETIERFGQLPSMIPHHCPTCHGVLCDNCNYLVQYTLESKKVYCLKNEYTITTERRD